jgi:hypothetical protein
MLGLPAAVLFAAFLVPSSCGCHSTEERVQGGLSLSNPARTAVENACSEDALGGATQASLGLAAPTDYSGKFTESVRVDVHGAAAAEVTVVLRGLAPDNIPDGATVVYRGRCDGRQLGWSLESTLPEPYRPRI